MNVPFLTDSEIERQAEGILLDFRTQRSWERKPPIPIAEIVGDYFGLRVSVVDLCRLLEKTDILGALSVQDKLLLIDFPLVSEKREGQFHFTLAHETGHWHLHRNHVLMEDGTQQLFEGCAQPRFICRKSSSRNREEIQADKFAAALLMPRDLIYAAWAEAYPNRTRILLSEVLADPSVFNMNLSSGYEFMDPNMIETQIFHSLAMPFAEQFCVSTTAMRIRFDTLKLLQTSEQEDLF